MLRSLFIASLPLLLAMAAACNGGDGGATPSPGVTATATPAATPRVTPPPGARLAVYPDDVTAFLASFGEKTPTRQLCPYDEETGLVDCREAGLGLIQLDPLVPGTGVECGALLLEGTLVGVSCTSQSPIFGSIYKMAEE